MAITYTPQATSRIHWRNLFMGGSFHVLSILGIFYFSWSALAVALVFCWVSCCVGITLGYHRLLTHRAFKTFKWVEYALAIVGCIAWQNGPIDWVGTHRIHHAHTDLAHDPHSPVHGTKETLSSKFKQFMWGHFGWVIYQLEFNPQDACKDLARDPGMRLIERFFYVPGLALLAILYLAGEWYQPGQGLPWMIWAGIVRTTVMFHMTWLVNSAAHVWGYRNFGTADDSKNLWWVAIVTFGEGWHNNHHAQHRSAKHGMRWWEFDVTYMIIKMMQATGLAWDIVMPDLSQMTATPKKAPAPTLAPGDDGIFQPEPSEAH
jgi:fatty-acid desaturase